jgi:integrase
VAKAIISTELVRTVVATPPGRVTDYRHPRLPGFVLRARPTGVHSWRVQLADRSWISLGRIDEVTLSDARQAAQEARARAVLGAPSAKAAPAATLTLRAYLDERYGPWMLATHAKRSRQVSRIGSVFREFLDVPLSGITSGALEKWRVARTNRRLTPTERETGARRFLSIGTMNRDLAALQSALARALEWGLLQANPVKPLRRQREDKGGVIRYLSNDEEARLRDALRSRDAERRQRRESANEWRQDRNYAVRDGLGDYTDHFTPLVLLAVNTGLRRGELFQLRWQDISFTTRTLTVRGGGAKSGQTRHVPLNTEALTVLKRWKPEAALDTWPVFSGASESEPLTDVKKGWTSILTRAKVSSFRFHDLRHTFASKLVMAGVDLNTVRELLGHSTLGMTLRYAHLAPEHKAAAVERLVAASGSKSASTNARRPELVRASPRR